MNGAKRILALMAKKKAIKKPSDPSAGKREVRELSEKDLEQITGGANAPRNVLADAKHGMADAKHGMADAKHGLFDLPGGAKIRSSD